MARVFFLCSLLVRTSTANLGKHIGLACLDGTCGTEEGLQLLQVKANRADRDADGDVVTAHVQEGEGTVDSFYPAMTPDVLQYCGLTPTLTERGMLGLWKDYASFHKKELAGSAPRVLRYIAPKEGGIGDRMRGLAGALYLAMKTNRALLLQDFTASGLIPRFIDWTSHPKTEGQAVDATYVLFSRSVGDPWEGRLQNHVPNINASDLTSLDILDALTHDSNKDVTITSNYFAQLLLPEELSAFMSNSDAAHENRVWDGVRARATGCAFHYLTRPSVKLYDLVAKYRSSVGLGPSEVPNLGVHVRFGDFIAFNITGLMFLKKTLSDTREKTRDVRMAPSQNNTNGIIDCANNVVQSALHSGGCSILFSSDWSQARRWAMDYGKKKSDYLSCAIRASPDEVRHSAELAYSKQEGTEHAAQLAPVDDKRAISGFAEMMVLASSQTLLLSHSGFGFTARAIALRPTNTVHSLPHECSAVQFERNEAYD